MLVTPATHSVVRGINRHAQRDSTLLPPTIGSAVRQDMTVRLRTALKRIAATGSVASRLVIRNNAICQQAQRHAVVSINCEEF
jgi:hypothetical protein